MVDNNIKKPLFKTKKELCTITSPYLLKCSAIYQPIKYDNLFYQLDNDLSEENKNYQETNIKQNFNELKKEFNQIINKDNEFAQVNIEENEYNCGSDERFLSSLKYISICQFCKNKFDNEKCLPNLLKCGHIFCFNCIKKYFINQKGIVCPTDGLVTHSIKELKLLKNITSIPEQISDKVIKKKNTVEKMNFFSLQNDINDNNYCFEKTNKNNSIYNNYISNYCPIHETQRLSHIINDTNEVICVYCAFERLKANPNIQIKEIKEKYVEYNEMIKNIINKIEKNLELINNTIDMISKNKENEIKKLNKFYDNIIKYIEVQKKEKMQQIENISNENIHDLEQTILIFNNSIEQGERVQKKLEKEESNCNQEFSVILNDYNNFMKLKESIFDDKLNSKLKYMRFKNKSEINVKEYLSKISELYLSFRVIKYTSSDKNEKNNKNNYINKIVKIGKVSPENNLSSIQYYKIMASKKLKLRNKLINISNSNDSIMKTYSNEKYKTNNQLNNKDINSFFQSTDVSHSLKINNFRNKLTNSTRASNTERRQSFLKKINDNKFILNNGNSLRKEKHNSLLEIYFEFNKNKNKKNNTINFGSYKKSSKKNKNCKTFNNLNLLNNFYNLNLYKKGNKNNNEQHTKIGMTYLSSKKKYKKSNIKIYNESLFKLIPKEIKKLNKTYNSNY